MAREWRNWAGDVSCTPSRLVEPQSEAEIRDLVRRASERGEKLRIAGSGHSFTPLVPTSDVLVSLARHRGLVRIDRERLEVAVRAGTRLRELGEALFAEGLALENLGDIDRQTVAGAIATGTHGTGARLGSLSAQVEALALVTADGERLECSRGRDAELFDAARVSLGALGVLSEVTLRMVPAYKLAYSFERASVGECLERLDELVHGNRNFELYWFPHSERAQLKRLNESELPVTRGHRLSDIMLENGLFWAVSACCRLIPALCAPASRFCGRTVATHRGVGHSHRVYATPRLVRFHEMEYCLPRERFRAAFDAAREEIARRGFRVHFPLECRFAAADDIWLSPAYRRDCAYVAVHMYRGMPWEEYFAALERIFLEHEGRPHWGKWHSLGEPELATRYPRWSDFLEVRSRLDPRGTFLNAHLRELFGLDSVSTRPRSGRKMATERPR
jgi:FAD-linked oxidoreductase